MSIPADFRVEPIMSCNPPRSVSIPKKTYEEIKSKCLSRRTLWEDRDFPAVASSIYFQNPPSAKLNIQWKRPKEICCHAKLFVAGASRMDIVQGELDNHRLVAAVANITTNPALLRKVIPSDQSFDKEYAGVFRFQFWQYGRWVEVVIDDRLPTHDNKLIYMHSKNRHEFWTALLGKAYAKLHGSYEALNSGLGTGPITQISGGLVKRLELKSNAPSHLFQIMLKAWRKGCLMTCIITVPADGKKGSQLSNGLISGHSYSVTDIRTIQVGILQGGETIQMVRVRNPWGYTNEWKGAWSVGSEEWKTVPNDEKLGLGLVYEHDGEFWMTYEDFVSNFDRLEVCILGPGSLGDDEKPDGTRNWMSWSFEGAWQSKFNAGGCMDYKSTFWTNPKYLVTISDADSDDEDGYGSITIGLVQTHQKKGRGNLKIGYTIYQVPESEIGTITTCSQSFFDGRLVGRSKVFTDKGEVTGHHKLPPGEYVIVPSTFDPNEEGEFILRILSERQNDQAVELEQSTLPPDQVWPKPIGSRILITIHQFQSWAGTDGRMNTFELQEVLNNTFKKEFDFEGFTKDMARIMVAMYDTDFSGKLGFEQFKKLWKELLICEDVFRKLDVDGNGFFCSCEFREALNYLGFHVNNSTFKLIVVKYGDKSGYVRFDDFVNCYFEMKTKTMFWSNSVGGRIEGSNAHDLAGNGLRTTYVTNYRPTPPKQQWSEHAGKVVYRSMMKDETHNCQEFVQQVAHRSMMEAETENGHFGQEAVQKVAHRRMLEDETQNGHGFVKQVAHRRMLEDETQNGQEVVHKDEDTGYFNPSGYPNYQWIK